MVRQWLRLWNEKLPSFIHVIPDEDTLEHELSWKCDCKPVKELTTDGPHTIGVLWAHNAYDGRKS